MKQQYKIFVLEDNQFENLHEDMPFLKKEDLKNGMGFANPKNNEVYVRKTGVKDWDNATIMHEIDELTSSKSFHEDASGIRWKKGGVLRNILPFALALIPGVGPILAAASNIGMNQYAQSRHPEQLGKPGFLSALGQGVSGYFGGRALAGGLSGAAQGGTQAAAGFGNKAWGIGSGLIKGAMTGSAGLTSNVLGTPTVAGATGTLSKPLSTLPGGIAESGAKYGLTNTIANAAGTGLSSAMTPFLNTPGLASGLGSMNVAPSRVAEATIKSPINRSIETSTSPIFREAPISLQSNLPQVAPMSTAPKLSGSLLDKTKLWLKEPQNILGLASVGGSMLPKTPAFPETNIEELRTSLLSGQGISPLGQIARDSLSRIMSMSPSELYPTGTDAYYNAALRQTREAYKKAKDALAVRYNQFDPNYQQNTEYQELARRLDSELANVESDYAITEEQRRFELSRIQQYQAIQDSLQVDDQTMQKLIDVTRLSTAEAMQKYQISADDVNEIRRALGGFGGQLIQGSFTQNT